MTSCSRSGEPQNQETPLVGTWLLIEVYEPYGENPNGDWYPVQDGHLYTFYGDGTMSSDRFSCSDGLYEIEINENIEQRRIYISFDCETSLHSANFRMPYIESYLILIDEISCDEGCAERYVKISN